MPRPDREPDVDAPSFNLYFAEVEKAPELPAGVLPVYGNLGEEWYEQRVYAGLRDYTLVMMAKTRPDGQVSAMFKVKRPDGSGVLCTYTGWLIPELYRIEVAKVEASELQTVFDMANPQITEGRKINYYIKNRGGNGNGTKTNPAGTD